MKNKHAEFMKTADIIIKNGGQCKHLSNCNPCPAFEKDTAICKVEDLNNQDILQWFINWKEENEVKEMSRKTIFENEEQAMQLLRCLDFCESNIVNIDKLKKAGYIRKSPLQQKVERIEEALDDYISGHSVDVLDTFTGALEIIKILKEYHPEFKS